MNKCCFLALPDGTQKYEFATRLQLSIEHWLENKRKGEDLKLRFPIHDIICFTFRSVAQNFHSKSSTY